MEKQYIKAYSKHGLAPIFGVFANEMNGIVYIIADEELRPCTKMHFDFYLVDPFTLKETPYKGVEE
ncbi:hypothetical protein KCG48_10650 [Proteiniclasticum sp. BAD-10]|uniref:Uncharacterized protein n=1 Tax=Proteiniclasticum sediminis TaxID=2804028 RepID=A0A941HS01_9CLOT|nr:hypothetical protein [Proteiniclasticum sediminis]MBR0576792.1 hypothetical protein [Proteiniclasticum sediminis]